MDLLALDKGRGDTPTRPTWSPDGGRYHVSVARSAEHAASQRLASWLYDAAGAPRLLDLIGVGLSGRPRPSYRPAALHPACPNYIAVPSACSPRPGVRRSVTRYPAVVHAVAG